MTTSSALSATPPVERNQRAPVELAEDERTRAVDGIDDPRVRTRAGLEAVLFAEDAVLRIDAVDLAANRRFGIAIGNRHGIEVSLRRLVLDADARAEVRQDLPARHVREMHGEVGELSDLRFHRYCCAIVAYRTRPDAT